MHLMSGSSNREGRVEVYIDRNWGTICRQSGWTETVAGFICSQLGFSKFSMSSFRESH